MRWPYILQVLKSAQLCCLYLQGNGRDEKDRSSHNKVEDEAEEEEKESDAEEIDDSGFYTKEKVCFVKRDSEHTLQNSI